MRLTPALASLLALLCVPARAAERSVDAALPVSAPAPAVPSLPAIPQLPPRVVPLDAALAGQQPTAAPLPSAAAAPTAALAPDISATGGNVDVAPRRATAKPASFSPRGESGDNSRRPAPGLAADEQLRRLSEGAREILGTLGAQDGAAGGEAGKRLWDRAFDGGAGGGGAVAAAPAAAPAAASPQAFDNRFKTRGEVTALLGYDPAHQPARLLSDPQKAQSWVGRVTPPGRPSAVVKIAPEATIVNELAMRGILESFPVFSESLRAPRGVAYRRWLLKPVMVMEDVPNHNTQMTGADLPLPQKAALAMFALTFGVHDLNPGAFLQVGWKRTVLTDFERARTATIVPSGSRFGVTSELPWVSTDYLNDDADYRPAWERWRAEFSRPEARGEIAAILRRSGVPEREIEPSLALFADNLRRLPDVLAADVAHANRYFLESARRAGLSPAQTLGLSEINRAAQASPEGGALRDAARALLGDHLLAASTFHLEAGEAAALARRRDAFSPSARRRLLQLARSGGLRSRDGRLIDEKRAGETFDQLARWLAP